MTTSGEIFSSFLGYFVVGFAGVLLPLLILWVLSLDKDALYEKTFEAKWGVFYAELKKSIQGRMFNLFYMLRRLLFVLMVFLIESQGIY